MEQGHKKRRARGSGRRGCQCRRPPLATWPDSHAEACFCCRRGCWWQYWPLRLRDDTRTVVPCRSTHIQAQAQRGTKQRVSGTFQTRTLRQILRQPSAWKEEAKGGKFHVKNTLAPRTAQPGKRAKASRTAGPGAARRRVSGAHTSTREHGSLARRGDRAFD